MEYERPGFVLYLNQRVIINELTDQQAGVLFKAIYEYAETKKVPKLNKILKIVFLQFKNSLDLDDKRYVEKCEKNKKNIENYWKKKKEEQQKKENTNEYDRIRMYTNNKYKYININLKSINI